ncbi:type II toxin-antitoxin system VapC family toxin [Streptomyces anulatus]|uniref:type II toxin-antitoxin system VapC family toxin n=1 Tax=Streptomyces anulatus TaxID=1892 RepID=UPI003697CAC7
MIVLDTNVLSELARPKPEPKVLAWLDRLRASEIATTAVTAAEMWVGVSLLPDGRHKTELAQLVDGILNQDLRARVHPFDLPAAARYAHIASTCHRAGRPIGLADGQIAAICSTRGATLATRNTKNFLDTGVDLIDPWEQG